jgi:Spy/CpxP family protein refolding chaperone
MAPHSRLAGARRGRLSPEAQAELDLAQSVERARYARRWAFISTVLALIAAVGAAVAVALALSEADPRPPSASPAAVSDLRGELLSLRDEMRKAAQENRSKADEARGSSRAVSQQLEDLEIELASLSESDEPNDRRIRKLSDRLKQLRDEVDGLGFGSAFP